MPILWFANMSFASAGRTKLRPGDVFDVGRRHDAFSPLLPVQQAGCDLSHAVARLARMVDMKRAQKRKGEQPQHSDQHAEIRGQ